jgi:formiminotetrahydrofolate cyclodeaminase
MAVREQGGMGEAATVADWLVALSEPGSNPAAGSAAALAGGLGVALLIKLARLTPAERVPSYKRQLSRLVTARDRFAALAQADAVAVRTWLAHCHLPVDSPLRQAALREMVEVPLEVAELCHSVGREAGPWVERGHPPALPDGQAGLSLLDACCRIAGDLVQANLAQVADAGLWERVRIHLERLGDPRSVGRAPVEHRIVLEETVG